MVIGILVATLCAGVAGSLVGLVAGLPVIGVAALHVLSGLIGAGAFVLRAAWVRNTASSRSA